MVDERESHMTPVPGAPMDKDDADETHLQPAAPSLAELVFVLGLLIVFMAGFALLYQPLVMAMLRAMAENLT